MTQSERHTLCKALADRAKEIAVGDVFEVSQVTDLAEIVHDLAVAVQQINGLKNEASEDQVRAAGDGTAQ